MVGFPLALPELRISFTINFKGKHELALDINLSNWRETPTTNEEHPIWGCVSFKANAVCRDVPRNTFGLGSEGERARTSCSSVIGS